MLGTVSEHRRVMKNPQYWHFQLLAFSQDYWWPWVKKKMVLQLPSMFHREDLASTLLSLTLSVFMARETWFDIYFISFNPHDNLRRKRIWFLPLHRRGNWGFLRKNDLLMVIQWVPLQFKPSFKTRTLILLCVLSAQGYTFFDGPHFKVYPPEELLCFSDHLPLIFWFKSTAAVIIPNISNMWLSRDCQPLLSCDSPRNPWADFENSDPPMRTFLKSSSW